MKKMPGQLLPGAGLGKQCDHDRRPDSLEYRRSGSCRRIVDWRRFHPLCTIPVSRSAELFFLP